MSNTELRSITSHENVSCTDPIVIDDSLQRIRNEYLEMLGLRLTLAQAARFWCLDRSTCACLLDALVNARFLILTSDGRYARAQGHAIDVLLNSEAGAQAGSLGVRHGDGVVLDYFVHRRFDSSSITCG